MENKRKYKFFWDLLGDLDLGRPNLGRQTKVEVYRLMQYCFRDIIEQRYGTEEADSIFYDAGKLAGQHFYKHLIGDVPDVNAFVKRLQELLKDLNIGILRVEEEELDNGSMVMTVSEDLDCSGLPELEYEICVFDEGFIAALLECYTGKQFQVKEIDCWCTGDRTCRFSAKSIK